MAATFTPLTDAQMAEARARIEARRAEMRAVLQALEKAWSTTPERTLDEVMALCSWPFDYTPDAELLKALEKYAQGGG